MAESILQFQAGREAAMRGDKRDARRGRDWREGFDQVKRAKDASYVSAAPETIPMAAERG